MLTGALYKRNTKSWRKSTSKQSIERRLWLLGTLSLCISNNFVDNETGESCKVQPVLASRSCNPQTKQLAVVSAQPYHIITIRNSIPC